MWGGEGKRKETERRSENKRSWLGGSNVAAEAGAGPRRRQPGGKRETTVASEERIAVSPCQLDLADSFLGGKERGGCAGQREQFAWEMTRSSVRQGHGASHGAPGEVEASGGESRQVWVTLISPKALFRNRSSEEFG